MATAPAAPKTVTKTAVAPAAPPAGAAPGAPPVARLDVEPLITTHRIFAALDRQGKSLPSLHEDLFDSRLPVVLSALEAVGALADDRSFPFLARLVSDKREEVMCGAVRAMGKLKEPRAAALLQQLAKTARGERLVREILEALAARAAGDAALLGLLRQAARAALGSAGIRRQAAALYLSVAGEAALGDLLPDEREEIVEQILQSAWENPALAPRVVKHYAPKFAGMPVSRRAALVTLALHQDLPETAALLRAALADTTLEVRRAAYAAACTEPFHVKILGNLLGQLLDEVESDPSLEDEVQEVLLRAGKLDGAAAAVPAGVRSRVLAGVAELRQQLAGTDRQLASDTHELGWIITRAREYLEYYADEDFKAALLRWLRGNSADSAPVLLKTLQATAVRVEVRHFDGYSAIADLVKNPRRPGIALVARELALARTGKGLTFRRLVRAVRIATVFASTDSSGQSVMRGLFTWARQEKLFRLAEAALLAVARQDRVFATGACRDCLALPLGSKVLAIASLHLLRELDPGSMEPSAAALLSALDDPYVTLNAVEAVSAAGSSSNAELARALLSRAATATSAEVRNALASYLGGKMLLDVTENLKESALRGDEQVRAISLDILDRRITAGMVANRDGTVEFLFRILRGDHASSRLSAAVMLWKMGDDYAAEVLRDFLRGDRETDAVEILRRLKGTLRAELLPSLVGLIARQSAPLQEALRELLLSPEDPALRVKVLDAVFRLRDSGPDAEEGAGEDSPTAELASERASFKFERESIQELVMLFSDIQGYSKKAQLLTPQQLSTLLQEYEKLLLAHVDAHGGELVKRMGDGHMIVFRRPLDAVLAAIRIQKSMVRFNRYRDETSRVVIRIGIHAGKVVRKAGGDVLGNDVNIASRLESSARPGSLLVSERVYQKVKDYIHARELGPISVKNITEPIRVFEPFEIVLDLPVELDPLKTRAGAAATAVTATAAADADSPPASRSTAQVGAGAVAGPAVAASAAAPGRVSMSAESWKMLEKCFSALELACAGDNPAAGATILKQVLARWNQIRKTATSAPTPQIR